MFDVFSVHGHGFDILIVVTFEIDEPEIFECLFGCDTLFPAFKEAGDEHAGLFTESCLNVWWEDEFGFHDVVDCV